MENTNQNTVHFMALKNKCIRIFIIESIGSSVLLYRSNVSLFAVKALNVWGLQRSAVNERWWK